MGTSVLHDTLTTALTLYSFERCVRFTDAMGLCCRTIWAEHSSPLTSHIFLKVPTFCSLFHSQAITTSCNRFTMRSPYASVLAASPIWATSLSASLPCTARDGYQPVLRWEMIFSPMQGRREFNPHSYRVVKVYSNQYERLVACRYSPLPIPEDFSPLREEFIANESHCIHCCCKKNSTIIHRWQDGG